MRLMLKIKNGTPPIRKVALRQITDKAREFGPGPLFNQILPLLMSPSVTACASMHRLRLHILTPSSLPHCTRALSWKTRSVT